MAEIPSGPAEDHLQEAVTALEHAYTAIDDVGLIKNDHVYFDPKTIIPFTASDVTNHTDTALSALERAQKTAAKNLAIIDYLGSVVTLFESGAKAIPKADDTLASYTPYLDAVDNRNWVEAMNTAESAVLAGRDGYEAISTAADVISGLPQITVIEGFQTDTHTARLEILDDAFLGLTTSYMGFYHVAYGMSWYDVAFVAHSQGENRKAAEAMQKAASAYKYSIQLFREAENNEQLTYGRRISTHFCAADSIGVAAVRYRKSFLELTQGNTSQAQSLADSARSELKRADCQIAYHDYALQWADQKGEF